MCFVVNRVSSLRGDHHSGAADSWPAHEPTRGDFAVTIVASPRLQQDVFSWEELSELEAAEPLFDCVESSMPLKGSALVEAPVAIEEDEDEEGYEDEEDEDEEEDYEDEEDEEYEDEEEEEGDDEEEEGDEDEEEGDDLDEDEWEEVEDEEEEDEEEEDEEFDEDEDEEWEDDDEEWDEEDDD